jgi:hypothetical protein
LITLNEPRATEAVTTIRPVTYEKFSETSKDASVRWRSTFDLSFEVLQVAEDGRT